MARPPPPPMHRRRRMTFSRKRPIVFLLLLGFFLLHEGEVHERVSPVFIDASSAFTLPFSWHTQRVAGDDIRVGRAATCTRAVLKLAATPCARGTPLMTAGQTPTAASPIEVHIPFAKVRGFHGARQLHVIRGTRERRGGGRHRRRRHHGRRKGDDRTPTDILTGVGGRKRRRVHTRCLWCRYHDTHVPQGGRRGRIQRDGMRS